MLGRRLRRLPGCNSCLCLLITSHRHEDCQNRPPSKAAGTPTSPEREKASSKKARHSSTTTERALQSQIQKQGKEICQLREIVSELGQAGTPPSTPSRVQQLPLPCQAVYTQPTYHVSPPMYGGLWAYEYQQPCFPTPPKAASPIQTGNGILPQCPALMATPSAQQYMPTAHGYPPAALDMNTDFASSQRPQAPPSSLASSTAATPTSGRGNLPEIRPSSASVATRPGIYSDSVHVDTAKQAAIPGHIDLGRLCTTELLARNLEERKST